MCLQVIHPSLNTSTHTGPNCLRAGPAPDYTNGFFVALFEREQGSSDNLPEVEGKHTSLSRPSHGDTPPSHDEDTHSVQEGMPTAQCGHSSVLQRFEEEKGCRHLRRRRVRLVLCRRFSRRRALHCRKLFRPSFVLYPKYRCYYNGCA